MNNGVWQNCLESKLWFLGDFARNNKRSHEIDDFYAVFAKNFCAWYFATVFAAVMPQNVDRH